MRHFFACALMIAVLTLPMTAYAADNLVGTWKLNLAKSTYNPGPAPRSIVATFEATADGIK